MTEMVVLADAVCHSPAQLLLGRDDELARIREFLVRATSGGQAMLVVGDPGIGKTAVLDAAAEEGQARGIKVLRAAGVQFEAEVPFSVLHQLLAPIAAQFKDLSAPHRQALNVALGFDAGPPPDRLLVCTAALTLVRTASSLAPLLIVVDDVHWLDDSTASVLGFLARRLHGTPVAFLAAMRTGADGFFDHAGLPELELQPLDEVTASQLMMSRFPLLSAPTRRWLLAEAGGSPLALLELPRALHERGSAPASGLAPVVPLGRRLQRVYAPGLAEIPERSRQALLMMALGDSADVRVLAAHGDGWATLASLAPAERARLLDLGHGSRRPAFRHPLVRAAVVELATGDQRRRAHRRLADLMSDQPDRRAWHLGAATLKPDEEIAAQLDSAAQAIRKRGEGASAVIALVRASELSPAEHDRARRLAEAAYVAASVTGDLRDARALLHDARHIDRDHAASAEIEIAASFVMLAADGDVISSCQMLQEALDTAAGRNISPMTAECAARTAALACHFGQTQDLCEALTGSLRQFAGKSLDDRGFSSTLIADPATSPEADLDRLDSDIESLTHQADPDEIVRVARTSMFVDRLPGCRQALHRVACDALEAGALTSVIHANTLLAWEAYQTGRWEEADQLAKAAGELAASRGYELLRWNAQAVTTLVTASRGGPESAISLADEAIRWAAPRGARQLRTGGIHAHVLTGLAHSDFEAAYHYATEVSPAGQLAASTPYALWVILDLVEAAMRTGRGDEAAAHVRAMREGGTAGISPRLALLSGAAAALIAPDEGSFKLFSMALAADGAERWPFDVARVHLLYGERLRRNHAMSQSRAHLTAALEGFRRLGATGWEARAAMELRATGQTRPRTYQHGLEALTPQELEIALLAATGLSNKQIGCRLYLSHRTVGAHLYRIFPKLGITSRAALRDALPPRPGGVG